MKKLLCAALSLSLLIVLAACGGKPTENAFVWTREGYFTDENDHLVSVMPSEDEEHPGWLVSCMLDEGMHGWYVQQEGSALRGDITAPYENEEPFVVTVTEEGEDGIAFAVEGGATYHLTPYELPEAAFAVTVNTEGSGEIAYAAPGEVLAFNEEYPSQSAYIGLAEPETYRFGAKPEEGWKFLRWTKNGETLSKEPEIELEITEDTALTAVFGVAGTDETPVDLDAVTTLGELLGLPNYGVGYSGTQYVYAFEQDGDVYRAEAELPEETSEALFALAWDDPEYEQKERALVEPLKVTEIVNLSAAAPTQEELDALIGKTGAELFDDGWYSQGWNLEDMEFYMGHGVYGFTVTMAGEVPSSDDFSDESINDLVVTAVRYEGVENPAAIEDEEG